MLSTVRTVVVIGASGHLGRALVRRLAAEGCAVLAGEAAVDGADVVVHVDDRVALPDGGDPLGPIDSSAVDALLRACAEGRIGRLVHVSPGDAVLPGPLPTGDELVRRAAGAGLDVVAVHPTGIIGPGDPGTSRLGRLLLDLWEHRPTAPVGGGLDWVDVRDVAAGTVAAATTATAGADYVLAGHWATVEEVVAEATRVAAELASGERQPAVVVDRPWAAAPTGGADVGARRDLGWSPRPLDATIRDTFDWFAARDLVRDAAAHASLVPA